MTTPSSQPERREAAYKAFMSDHPLIHAYRHATGQDDVPLKSLIAFTEALPQPVFNACMFSAGVRS
jgi:hypothetical protein